LNAAVEKSRRFQIVDKDHDAVGIPDVGGLGVRWLKVWGLDALGECMCLIGSRRYRGVDNYGAVGGAGRCARPGKHPWHIEVDGEPRGFRHGALQAVDRDTTAGAQALAESGAGTRLAAVPGDRVIVLDLDGPRAFATFVRLAPFTWDCMIGACRTPRGYHVWLKTAVDGWSSRAAKTWLAMWLAGQRGIGADGLGGLDVRSGDRSYVVWPGDSGERGRRWLSQGEWAAVVARAWAGPAWDLTWTEPGQWGPPWLAGAGVGPHAAMDEKDLMRTVRMTQASGGRGAGKSSADDAEDRIEIITAMGQDWAGERLALALERFAQMDAGAGRNNRLNQICFYQGATAVWLGCGGFEEIKGRLVDAGKAVGTHGVEATVRSGLGAGLARLKAST
jgi:hypothetical protein